MNSEDRKAFYDLLETVRQYLATLGWEVDKQGTTDNLVLFRDPRTPVLYQVPVQWNFALGGNNRSICVVPVGCEGDCVYAHEHDKGAGFRRAFWENYLYHRKKLLKLLNDDIQRANTEQDRQSLRSRALQISRAPRSPYAARAKSGGQPPCKQGAGASDPTSLQAIQSRPLDEILVSTNDDCPLCFCGATTLYYRGNWIVKRCLEDRNHVFRTSNNNAHLITGCSDYAPPVRQKQEHRQKWSSGPSTSVVVAKPLRTEIED